MSSNDKTSHMRMVCSGGAHNGQVLLIKLHADTGIKPAQHRKSMGKVVATPSAVPGCISINDNVLVYESTLEEHNRNLEMMLARVA